MKGGTRAREVRLTIRGLRSATGLAPIEFQSGNLREVLLVVGGAEVVVVVVDGTELVGGAELVGGVKGVVGGVEVVLWLVGGAVGGEKGLL